ncbi:MAG: outer membrane beta-barrel protein [Rikenellaceae bacterium]|nr:outer membrane beta-barrel protein [Rikenellaceae bacterium]
MKTIKYMAVAATLMIVGLAMPDRAHAQLFPRGYINVDWQFNGTVANDFVEKGNGWGMNFEGGGYLGQSQRVGLGLFLAYSTNNKYVPRQTLVLNNQAALTTDQQHSIFQIPFGVSARVRFLKGSLFEPYIGAKVGTVYSKISSFYSTVELYGETWGFYVAPEIGVTIMPFGDTGIGFHVAAYYGYGTNDLKILKYSINGLKNVGFRVGIAF